MKRKKNQEPKKIQEVKHRMQIVMPAALKKELFNLSDTTHISASKIIVDALAADLAARRINH